MSDLTTASAAANRAWEDVCNLPPETFPDRLAMIRRDILPLATRREDLANGVALEFDYTNATEKTLEDFIAFERECCSGLTWDLSRTDARILRLSIQGLSPTSEFFQIVKDDSPAAPPGIAKRVAQSLGLGAGAAFFLCCIAPLGLAAIAGASIAAPFATLDNPLAIAFGSLALAVPAWLWLNRRAKKSACGC